MLLNNSRRRKRENEGKGEGRKRKMRRGGEGGVGRGERVGWGGAEKEGRKWRKREWVREEEEERFYSLVHSAFVYA